MTHADLRITIRGERVRVVVAGDVVALPDYRWALGSFGSGISVEWLLHDARLPGAARQRLLLAEAIVAALVKVHGS